MKLGELLVREGKMTHNDLEEVLKGQAIFGGRFGTNLVEMGFLEEDELAMYLSQKSGVPCARSEQFLDLSPQIIKSLPEATVIKHRVVPIGLNNRKLSLAMADPSNFAAIDEISFATGYIVMPHITPEIRLLYALEKYYNVRRELRYIPVAGGGRNRTRTVQQPGAIASPQQPASSAPLLQAAPPTASEPEGIDIFELAPLEDECFGDLEAWPIQATHPASLADLGLGLKPEPPPQPSPEPDFSLEAVLRGLTEAPDRDGIASLVVGYSARQFNRSALFMVKGGVATGWLAQVGTAPVKGFESLEIPLNETSVLKSVADSLTFYRGPFPITPCNNKILAALGGSLSMNQFLAPLIMMGRVVAILYVEGGTRQLDESLPELQKLLAKVSMAFEILILKNKILLTSAATGATIRA